MACVNLKRIIHFYKQREGNYIMKKIVTIIALVASLNSTAFFTEIVSNQAFRDLDNNGIFAYNSYSYWDPRWYAEEFISFINTIETDVNGKSDDEF